MIEAIDERMLGMFRFLLSCDEFSKEESRRIVDAGNKSGLDGLVRHLELQIDEKEAKNKIPEWMQVLVNQSVEREIERAILGITMAAHSPHHARNILTYTNKVLYYASRKGVQIEQLAKRYGGISQDCLKSAFRLYSKGLSRKS